MAGTSSSHASDPKPRRRWLQFSLRTLLIAVFFFALLFGWIETKINRTRREVQAVTGIQQHGGAVWYVIPPTASRRDGPRWLRRLVGDDFFFADIVSIKFARGATDQDLAALDDLLYLPRLDVSGTDITDAGLEHVKALQGLRKLDLRGTKVTEEGIARLRKALPTTNIHSDSSAETELAESCSWAEDWETRTHPPAVLIPP